MREKWNATQYKKLSEINEHRMQESSLGKMTKNVKDRPQQARTWTLHVNGRNLNMRRLWRRHPVNFKTHLNGVPNTLKQKTPVLCLNYQNYETTAQRWR